MEHSDINNKVTHGGSGDIENIGIPDAHKAAHENGKGVKIEHGGKAREIRSGKNQEWTVGRIHDGSETPNAIEGRVSGAVTGKYRAKNVESMST